MERGWVQATNETKRQLAQMLSRGAKFEYMEMAKQLKDYGYLHFAPCTCDYPMTNTTVDVLIGGRELVLRFPGTHDNPAKEGRFKVCSKICLYFGPEIILNFIGDKNEMLENHDSGWSG